MFWFFVCEARGILAPRPGIEPTPPALEGEVLTTGPPEKSLLLLFIFYLFIWLCWVLVVAGGSLVVACELLVAACMWDLIP